MVTAIIIFLGMMLFLLLWGKKNTSGKTTLVLAEGWIVKCFGASTFFYVYAEVYAKGKLAENSGANIQEAKILNSVHPHFVYFIN